MYYSLFIVLLYCSSLKTQKLNTDHFLLTWHFSLLPWLFIPHSSFSNFQILLSFNPSIFLSSLTLTTQKLNTDHFLLTWHFSLLPWLFIPHSSLSNFQILLSFNPSIFLSSLTLITSSSLGTSHFCLGSSSLIPHYQIFKSFYLSILSHTDHSKAEH